ncbi:helix-turn-helix domain-containing protein [uncultured Kiloniella sp.]|uniref:ArsR/SmtB family transcription factor n=1 Tax=Kiloniella sp. TaxID=1938587 RepID=UPI0026265A79|nr:helix-turn-helix domain-containing protein [uncultured Kiloniella sp.]
MPDDEGHPSVDEMQLGNVLSALSDPLRRRVIRELSLAPVGCERTCASFELPVSKATTTHHFKVMRESGLIRQVNRGNSRAAQLRIDDIENRFPGLLDMIRSEQGMTK